MKACKNFLFKNFKNYLVFIYLAALGLGFSTWDLLLRHTDPLSSCGGWAQPSWYTDPVALQHVGS